MRHHRRSAAPIGRDELEAWRATNWSMRCRGRRDRHMSAARTLFVLAAVAAAGFVALAIWGSARWRAGTAALVARLDASVQPSPASPGLEGELAGLPPPVQRYFRRVLPAAAPIVRSARLVHEGEFNLATDGTVRWKPFASIQEVRMARPGFVWHARVFAAPGVAVQVHDAYIAGEGLLQAALLGLVTVAEQRGTGDFARDELLRWLAEAAWYPTALLPSQGVRWEGVDAQRARATLHDGALAVTLEFEFGADDLIARVYAPGRGRLVGGRSIQTPWEGRWRDYAAHSGVWVPHTGEVAWLLPGGRLPYWRGKLTAVEFDSAHAAR